MVIIPYMEQVGYVIWSKHGLFDGHESIKRDSNITSGRNPYKQMDLLSTYPIKSCRLYAGTNTGFLLGEFWVRCMPLACPYQILPDLSAMDVLSPAGVQFHTWHTCWQQL